MVTNTKKPAAISPLAGKPPPKEMLVDPARLEREYYHRHPDPGNPTQMVSFGTSGHRGTSLRGTFTEAHILAITQALCDYRRGKGLNGPLYMGKDTHALSGPAQRTALEVLAANNVETIIQPNDGVTPTPVISRAILIYNRGRKDHLADGVVITPSHNPPEDGGFKYNPPHGGPAETGITKWVQQRANELLREDNVDVKRVPYATALEAATTHDEDFILPYVNDLRNVIDMDAIRAAGLKLGVDPLGGASLPYWEPINSLYGLGITVVNPKLDPTFSFMTVDHDGKIRMDCSSPYAMAGLVQLKDQYRVAFGNDPDSDRHGIVTPTAGLMNPNHYLAVAIGYLLTHRPGWSAQAAVGKSLVSSSMIDRVVGKLGRRLAEVPVGFKYFAPHLFDGSYCFGGEESAGMTIRGHLPEKDGILACLLVAEMIAARQASLADQLRDLFRRVGREFWPVRENLHLPEEVQAKLPDRLKADFKEFAGRRVTKVDRIDGLQMTFDDGEWLLMRPSGTEPVVRIYTEAATPAASQKLAEEARAWIAQ